MTDTPPEIAEIVRQKIMARSAEERFVMGARSFETERDIDQVFDLLAILRDESKRVEFLEELFKFRLREKI